jgi:hypothetical protein
LGSEAFCLFGFAVAEELALYAGGLAFCLIDLFLGRRGDRYGVGEGLAGNRG